jgi:hypothetical protein
VNATSQRFMGLPVVVSGFLQDDQWFLVSDAQMLLVSKHVARAFELAEIDARWRAIAARIEARFRERK